jgi:hypothetical protein
MSISRKPVSLLLECSAAMLGMFGTAASSAVAQAPPPSAGKSEPAAAEVKMSEESARRIMALLTGSGRSERVAEDPAFDRIVDLAAVAKGIQNYDAGMLADGALAIAEAERIFGRKHASGISAAFLLRKAATVAADTGDKATLARLTAAAEKLGLKDAVQVETPRGAERPTSLESPVTKSEAFVSAYRTAKAAELTADSKQLERAEQMANGSGLSADEKTSLQKALAGIRGRLPQKPSQEEESLQVVTKQFFGIAIIIQGTWKNAQGNMMILAGNARNGNAVIGNIVFPSGESIRYAWIETYQKRGQIYLGPNGEQGPIYVSLPSPTTMRWEFGFNKLDFTKVN